MTSSIGSSYGAMGMMHRPDPSQMANRLFSKLDTKNQGYIEKSDLESALSQVSGAANSANGVSADDILKQFDSDSDGKITKDEMSSGFQKLADELDSQFNSMRMGGFGGQGMPPPPPGGPGGGDTGFTKDELTSQLQEIGTSDSKRSDLISNIVSNFDQADTDGDGKVTMQEAQAYDKASKANSADASTGAAGASAGESSEAKLMHQIMQLMHAYGNPGQDDSQSALSSLLSVAA